jgi:hypothetical protein
MSEASFLSYLVALPEKTQRDELAFSAERREAIFRRMDADGDGAVGLEDFKVMFIQRYICEKGVAITDIFEIGKSKSLAKAEPGDAIDVLTGLTRAETTGTLRVECKHVPSGEKGWVTLKGNQGSVYLKAYGPFETFLDQAGRCIKEAESKARRLDNTLNQKLRQHGKMNLPTHAEAKKEVASLRGKVVTIQKGLVELRNKVETGKKSYLQKETAERNAHIEVRERKEADALLSDASGKLEAVEAAGGALEAAAQPLLVVDGVELEAFATPQTVSESVEKLKASLAQLVKEARLALKAMMDKCGKKLKGPLADARIEIQKMNQKIEGLNKDSTKVPEAVRKKITTIVEKCSPRASAALLDEGRRRQLSVEKLFAEMAGDGDQISEEAFTQHLAHLEGLMLPAQHARLLASSIEAGGIGRWRFTAFVQKYFRVAREIAITDVFEMKDCKTLRKAEKDELFEARDGPRTDSKLGLSRVKGVSLKDGTEGWISVKGNQGTAFLEPVNKPFYYCHKEEVALEAQFEGAGQDALRVLQVDEVVELLQGPCQVTQPSVVRMRVHAVKDTAQGWITTRNRDGVTFAEKTEKLYCCVASVAMTDGQDVKKSKVLRKLEEKELFEAAEFPVKDESTGTLRCSGRALKDGQTGWVTLKGNAGTVFVEAQTKYWQITKGTTMNKRIDADFVRALEVGELCRVLEGPKEEKPAIVQRLRGRALKDGTEGWLTWRLDSMKPWSAAYACLEPAPLHNAQVEEGAAVVRQISKGEEVEYIDGPNEDGKVVRMKFRALKDGAIGWSSVRSAAGKRLFKCL